MGVDLKMKRASVFNVASSFLATARDLRRPKKLPLASLVVGDESPDVLLHFTSRNTFGHPEDMPFSLLLLSAFTVHVAHACPLDLFRLLSNHVGFIPLLFDIITKMILLLFVFLRTSQLLRLRRGVLVSNEGSIE